MPDSPPHNPEKIDVAVNIMGKPLQTALSILSLLERSGDHVGKIWLQYEPVGSKYDTIPPFLLPRYLSTQLNIQLEISQPDVWLAREPLDMERMADKNYRMAIRYQHAFENSQSRLLFLMHNDVYILKDILGALKNAMGDAFAIGPIGQCWNCPAANRELMRQAMGRGPCQPAIYTEVQPSHAQLLELYSLARQKGIFARPYEADGFRGEFEKQPWPLPECRVNEWICLLDLQKTRPLTMPFGKAYPPGAYKHCAGHNLDVVTPWFRDMHALGLRARHFDISRHVRHWVGTGKKTAIRHARAEGNALGILRKHFPAYTDWLAGETGDKTLQNTNF